MPEKSEEFGARFKQKVNEIYPTAQKFAEKMKMKPQSLQNYFRGRVPSPTKLRRFAEALGVSQDWLLYGKDFDVETQKKEKDYYRVPVIEGRLSCGPGTVVPPGIVKELIWIPKKYLTGGGDGDRYAAVSVTGESMEPLLFDGDTVVIDRTDCGLDKLRKDGLYAVWNEKEDASFVKHLDYDKGARLLTLVSYNPEYSRRHGVEHIRLKKVTDNPVMGRVVFSFRRWK